MRIKMHGMELVISPLMLPMLIAIFFMGQLDTYLVVFICALIHELAHIAVARRNNIRIESIEVLPVGLSAKISKMKGISLSREILIYSSGPIINIILAAALALIKYSFIFSDNGLIEKSIWINILLALVNLLPIIPFDGYKILNSILCLHIGYIKVSNICIVISKTVCITIFIPAIIIFGYTGNFSILLLCIFILIYIARYAVLNKAEPLVDIIYKKEMLLNEKMIKIRIIAAHISVSLIDIVKTFNKNKLYYVIVVDDYLKTVALVNEIEIIDYIIKTNTTALLNDLIKDNISQEYNLKNNFNI